MPNFVQQKIMHIDFDAKKISTKKGNKNMSMTKEKYEELTKAGQVLCYWCRNAECKKCKVQVLLEKAYAEALKEGVVEE